MVCETPIQDLMTVIYIQGLLAQGTLIVALSAVPLVHDEPERGHDTTAVGTSLMTSRNRHVSGRGLV